MPVVLLLNICKFFRFVPFLGTFVCFFNRIVFSCYFPTSVIFGKNLKLGYWGLGIVVHQRVVLGNNCHIDQNVTIGGTSKKFNVPKIGDNVYIGAGAKILGPISIGDNVVIGANSVVIRNIPNNCLVVGVPGKIIKTGILKTDYV